MLGFSGTPKCRYVRLRCALSATVAARLDLVVASKDMPREKNVLLRSVPDNVVDTHQTLHSFVFHHKTAFTESVGAYFEEV